MRGRSKNTFSSDINFKISVSLNALLLVFLSRTAITFHATSVFDSGLILSDTYIDVATMTSSTGF